MKGFLFIHPHVKPNNCFSRQTKTRHFKNLYAAFFHTLTVHSVKGLSSSKAENTIKVVYMTLALYSKSSEVLWQLCEKNRLKCMDVWIHGFSYIGCIYVYFYGVCFCLFVCLFVCVVCVCVCWRDVHSPKLHMVNQSHQERALSVFQVLI